MISDFEARLEFIKEIDKIKSIFRQTYLIDGSRKENDAEHSWHLAMMALVLAPYALPGTDVNRAVRMVLVHDLVEIDAGDTYLFDSRANEDKEKREAEAAERIFSLLPKNSAQELKGYWLEFEEKLTPEALFAQAMDRFQPFIHNWETNGISWMEHGISRDQVFSRLSPALKEFPLFHEYMEKRVDQAVKAGWLLP